MAAPVKGVTGIYKVFSPLTVLLQIDFRKAGEKNSIRLPLQGSILPNPFTFDPSLTRFRKGGAPKQANCSIQPFIPF